MRCYCSLRCASCERTGMEFGSFFSLQWILVTTMDSMTDMRLAVADKYTKCSKWGTAVLLNIDHPHFLVSPLYMIRYFVFNGGAFGLWWKWWHVIRQWLINAPGLQFEIEERTLFRISAASKPHIQVEWSSLNSPSVAWELIPHQLLYLAATAGYLTFILLISSLCKIN